MSLTMVVGLIFIWTLPLSDFDMIPSHVNSLFLYAFLKMSSFLSSLYLLEHPTSLSTCLNVALDFSAGFSCSLVSEKMAITIISAKNPSMAYMMNFRSFFIEVPFSVF